MRSNMALPLKLRRGDIQPIHFLTSFFYVFGVFFHFLYAVEFILTDIFKCTIMEICTL